MSAALKGRQAGRITICGEVDRQFMPRPLDVAAWDVCAEVRRRVDEMAQGRGYVAGLSHSVPCNSAILQAMQDAIASHGRQVHA